MIAKTAFILLVVVGVLTPLILWGERRQRALMQGRVGPNRADIAGISVLGLLHPLADFVKLLAKEDFVPAGAHRVLHFASPLIAVVPAIIATAVIPFGGRYTFGGTQVDLVVADLDWGLLYVFAIGSIAAYATVLAGCARDGGPARLGGLRAAVRRISCEVALGFSAVGVFMVFGTLRLTDMAAAQDTTFRVFAFLDIAWLEWVRLPYWGIFLQPLAFGSFLTAAMAENKRPPFDPESSAMRFGLFSMAESTGVVVIAGLVTTLFLGGFSIPYLSQAQIIAGVGSLFGTGFATGLCLVLHVLTFLTKLIAMIWLQLALRWTLPRFGHDQIMDLCWKLLLPLSLANVFVTGAVILWLGDPT